MKTTLLLFFILAFLVNTHIYAQPIKCSETKDPISGARILTSSYKDSNLKIEYSTGGIIKLYWPLNYAGQQQVAFKEGTSFILKLEDEQIITLKSIHETTPQVLIGTYNVISKYAFILEVSKEQVAQLATSSIIFSRTPTPTGEMQDVSDGWGKRAQKTYKKLFACINDRL